MENVSSSNGLEKRPKLRFPGFDEPWKVVVLGSILQERNEYSEKDGSYEHATLSKEGIYGKTARYDRDFLVSTENKKYKVTHYNDLCYNPANLKFGVICLNKYGDAIFSPIYITFEIDKEVDVDFLGANLTRWDFINRALRFQQGTVYERMAVSPEDFLSIQCWLPSKAEQIRISSLVQTLDQRIDKQEKLVEALKKYKRGLSDTLFAQIAQSPDCVIVKFGEAFELLQNNTFSREELTDIPSSVQNIHYGDVLIKYGAVVNIATDMPPYIKPSNDLQKFSRTSYLCDGDVVFADTAEDYSVGKAAEIVGVNGVSVLSGLHTIPCRPFKKLQPMYLGYYFNSSLFRAQIYPLVQGTKVSSISKGELVKVSVHIPNEGDQRRIASMLYSLDLRIVHEEQQVKALTDARAAFLHQLFI